MKPLFTIHAGEYLVGCHIEQHFKRVNVWVPSRDSGVDLLVSDRRNRKTVALQVKLSRDYLPTHMSAEFQGKLRACCWWTINRDKLQKSAADFWVFVLLGFSGHTFDFVVIPPQVLFRRLSRIHGPRQKFFQTYIWATARDRCFETRGLRMEEQLRVAYGSYEHKHRDVSEWLNNWTPVSRLNR